jgi:F-type H+-transporting ATPase subunit b
MSHPAMALQSELVPVPTELILGAFAFILIFGVLTKLTLPRITQMLKERTDAIEGGIERAGQAQQEAKRLLEQYRAQLAEARDEAARLRDEAREQGEQIVAEMREQAQAEARRITESAATQIESDRQQALAALRAEVGALSADLAGRIVTESLADEARQRRTVDRFLADLESQPAAVPAGPPARASART